MPNPIEQQVRPNLFPPDTVLGDAERRHRLNDAIADVIELTFELSAISRLIPGRAGRVAAQVVAGVEKQPQTGKVNVGQGTAMNFAPSPVGFLDPTSVGLSRAWWIPAGATQYIPVVVDHIGLGLAQQRAEDDRAAARRDTNEQLRRAASAQRAVMGLSNDDLEDILSGPSPLSEGAQLLAFRGQLLPDLRTAAQRELERRGLRTPRLAAASAEPDLQPVAGATAEALLAEAGGTLVALRALQQFFSDNPPDP